MSEDHAVTADQAASATTALRMALELPPEQVGIGQFGAMISNEIGRLRRAGIGDQEIAAMVEESTGGTLGADDVARHDVPPEARGPAGSRGDG